MTRITVNGLNYNVDVHGSGVPLVMLHGFTGSVENWHPLVGHLEQYTTAILIDLPGHGRSDAPPDPARYEMTAVARDLAKLLQALTASPVNLLGYSMGGRLALYMAVHYPDLVKTLILESASPGLAEAQERLARRKRDEALADAIEREGVAAFVSYWENLPLFASQKRLPEAVRQQLRAQRLRNRPHGLANSLRGMGTGVQPPLWDDLTHVRQPVLLMAGELDAKFARIAKQMQARLPHAQLDIVPDAGHTIHLEQPGAFEGQVITFIHLTQLPIL